MQNKKIEVYIVCVIIRAVKMWNIKVEVQFVFLSY